MTERRPHRNPRLRLACARCQRRKIRCDTQLPSCTNCVKASAICNDGESLRLRPIPSDSVASSRLERRVTWLESIIRERLPDVDLSAGPPPDWPAGAADDCQHPVSPHVGPNEPMLDANASRPQDAPTPAGTADQSSAHEIGLVSVGTNSDLRYVGPSSGYFLARVLLSHSPRKNDTPEHHGNSGSMAPSVISELVEAVQSPLPLPEKIRAKQLCRIYFDVIHDQYPILHEPSFLQALDRMYDDNAQPGFTDPYTHFQVYMVLAISSTILSHRARYHIPGESYCLSALQEFDRLNVENSLPGLQCLLLLLVFTIHSPCMRLNVWYLNYQCIAAVLDLGLQRDITMSSGISLLNQEMRKRIFWVVFSLDRTIATMMGRPIGLRDEACELRLPQDLNDHALIGAVTPPNHPTGDMAYPIHLFKLAKLNSEIKYVANSIVRDAPTYAYPTVADMHGWHRGMLEELDQWAASIPQSASPHSYIRLVCELRYHGMRMLLLRPSPAIPRPSTESLVACHVSSCRSIQLFDQLYRQDMLVHSWITFHGIVSSTITALYCIRAVPDIARNTEVDVLMNHVATSLSIISATGEHWSGAKRCRDILDGMGRWTVRWVKTLARSSTRVNVGPAEVSYHAAIPHTGASATEPTSSNNDTSCSSAPSSRPLDAPPGMEAEDSFWPGPIGDFDFGDIANVDTMMRNLFEDFISPIECFHNDA